MLRRLPPYSVERLQRCDLCCSRLERSCRAASQPPLLPAMPARRSDCNLWPEDLPPASVVLLSGDDDLMASQEVYTHLQRTGIQARRRPQQHALGCAPEMPSTWSL